MENINNDELDLVTFSDEEGNEFQMEVWDYFEHEGQEYAILFDLESEQDEDAETEVYIMKVTVDGEDEIFLPADEDKMDELTEIVEKMLDEAFCDEDERCQVWCSPRSGCTVSVKRVVFALFPAFLPEWRQSLPPPEL